MREVLLWGLLAIAFFFIMIGHILSPADYVALKLLDLVERWG